MYVCPYRIPRKDELGNETTYVSFSLPIPCKDLNMSIPVDVLNTTGPVLVLRRRNTFFLFFFR